MIKFPHREVNVMKISYVNITITITLSLLYVSGAWSGNVLHNGAFSFLFGNHIDTHQESKLAIDNNGNVKSLKGRFYIIYTGATNEEGIPIARHPPWRKQKRGMRG